MQDRPGKWAEAEVQRGSHEGSLLLHSVPEWLQAWRLCFRPDTMLYICRTTTELKNKSEEGKVFPPVFLKDKINIKVITVLKHLKYRKKKGENFLKLPYLSQI